jgi:energy-coupling factor transporter ATP-binding protein EcfA2
VAEALIANELVRGFGGLRVLDGVSLSAAPGRRIGLIGENGAGRSTLLRLLAGVDQPDGGTVERPPDLGFLHQEMPYAESSTVADVLDDALAEAREDLAELDRLAAVIDEEPELYAERLELAQRHEAWDADRRADAVGVAWPAAPVGPGQTSRRTVRRPATQARARPARGRSTGPAAARRTDQPPFADVVRRAGGRVGPRTRHDRASRPRPPAAGPVAGSKTSL